jgi:hypothetical protein
MRFVSHLQYLGELCDSIAEVSLENRQRFEKLRKKYPTSKVLDEFDLVSGGLFEQQSYATLRKFD